MNTGVPPTVLGQPESAVRPDERARSPGRVRTVSLAFALAFVAGAVVFPLVYDSGRSPSALTVVLLVAVYAAASRIEFEVGSASVVPTEVVLVPMLFLLPLELVPAYVALALVVAHVPELLRRQRRLTVLIGSARHAFGPALVLIPVADHGPTLSDWPWYLAALAAQFALDTGGFVVRDWLITGQRPSLRQEAFFSAWGVDAALAPIGYLAAVAATIDAGQFLLVVPLLALLAIFAQQRRLSIERAFELGSAYRGTAFLLADVIEAKDSYTGAHSRQVVELVLDVTDELGLSAEERRQAELAALLHDVGKMWVPSALISKEGELTPEEREVVNTHSIEGERMLQRVGGALGEVGSIVRSCHERWDGSGYPDGLEGTDIPLVARIVACCDAYSAMTTDRSYRIALSNSRAIAELRAKAGTQFDPAVVASLVRVLER